MASSEDDSPIELHTPPQFYDGGWDSDSSCDLDKIKDLCTIADEDEADNCTVPQNPNPNPTQEQKESSGLNTEKEEDGKTALVSQENTSQVECEALKQKENTQNSNKENEENKTVDNEPLEEEYSEELRPFFRFNDKPAVFKIYPVEAADWKLGDWIKLCGGICLKENEDSPFVIQIIDLLWCQENNIQQFVKPRGMQRRDFFESRFIYDTYTKEQLMNLNLYKTGKSLLPDYDANLILQQKLSWHEIISASSSTAFTDKEMEKKSDSTINERKNKQTIDKSQKIKESGKSSTNEESLPQPIEDRGKDKEGPEHLREKSPPRKEFKIKRSQLRNPPGRRQTTTSSCSVASKSPSAASPIPASTPTASTSTASTSTSGIPSITTLSEARRVGLQLAERLKEQAKQKKKTLPEKDPLSLSPERTLNMTEDDGSSVNPDCWTVSKATAQLYFNESLVINQTVGTENSDKHISHEREKQGQMLTANFGSPPPPPAPPSSHLPSSSSTSSVSPRSETAKHQNPKRSPNPNPNTKTNRKTVQSESGSPTDAGQKARRRGPTYSYEESIALLQYVCTNELHENFQQNRVWQDFEILNIVPNRSWQSLKEHFRRKIYENLLNFGCSDEDLKKFDEARKNKEERQKNGQRNRSKKPQPTAVQPALP